MPTETTKPKFTITIDMPLVLKRNPSNKDAVKEVKTSNHHNPATVAVN